MAILWAYNKSTSAVPWNGIASPRPPVLAPSTSGGVRGFAPVDVTDEFKGRSGADLTAIQALIAAGTVEFEWDGPPEYSPGFAASSSSSAPALSVSPSALNAVDVAGMGPAIEVRKAFAAGAGGAPDDVTIYSADAPFGFRILDAQLLVATAVAASDVQLRSASGGGGTALSDAFASSAAPLRVLDTGAAILGATPTVAAGGSLFIRRSDSGVAGEVVIRVMKT